MDTMWFFDRNGRKGPVDTSGLIRALCETPAPRQVKIWREGLGGWIEAGQVEEISAKLPPPLRDAVLPVVSEPARPPVAELGAIGTNYRKLVLLVGAQLALGFIARLTLDPLISALLFVVLLVITVVNAVTTYELMKGLGAGVPVLWAAGIFIPLLNLLVLAAISSRAQKWCRKYDIPVGFLGPDARHLERLRTE